MLKPYLSISMASSIIFLLRVCSASRRARLRFFYCIRISRSCKKSRCRWVCIATFIIELLNRAFSLRHAWKEVSSNSWRYFSSCFVTSYQCSWRYYFLSSLISLRIFFRSTSNYVFFGLGHHFFIPRIWTQASDRDWINALLSIFFKILILIDDLISSWIVFILKFIIIY